MMSRTTRKKLVNNLIYYFCWVFLFGLLALCYHAIKFLIYYLQGGFLDEIQLLIAKEIKENIKLSALMKQATEVIKMQKESIVKLNKEIQELKNKCEKK